MLDVLDALDVLDVLGALDVLNVLDGANTPHRLNIVSTGALNRHQSICYFRSFVSVLLSLTEGVRLNHTHNDGGDVALSAQVTAVQVTEMIFDRLRLDPDGGLLPFDDFAEWYTEEGYTQVSTTSSTTSRRLQEDNHRQRYGFWALTCLTCLPLVCHLFPTRAVAMVGTVGPPEVARPTDL